MKAFIEENYMQGNKSVTIGGYSEYESVVFEFNFKKETGMAYSEYLIQCRLQQASKLLWKQI